MPVPSVLLIHGPATGAWIWEHWRRELGRFGWQVIVLDLRGHGLSMPTDLAATTMQDYVADIASVTRQVEAAQGVHPVLGGWSTGGLLAMMYAAERQQPPALLLFSPAMPVEVAGRAPIDEVRRAAGETLGPEAFGVYPDNVEATMVAEPDLTREEAERLLEKVRDEQESGIAYRQVLRGISVPEGAVRCPSLILHTNDDAGPAASLAAHIQGETLLVPGTGRWSIVAHGAAVADAAPGVHDWLSRTLGKP